MFEYLSFLRPPPEHCALNNLVTLVPQIANDLRTEPCEDEHNIFFTWESASGALHRGGFSKLTTWRPGGMYKPLTVALPSEARPGDFWRLCLVTLGPDQGNSSLVLDLSQPDFGRLPFPVTSLPIGIVAGERTIPAGGGSGASRKPTTRQPSKASPNKPSKSKSKPIEQNIPTPHPNAPKQEKIERFYLLPLSSHTKPESRSTLRITEQTSFDLDKKIWDSGVAVSSWLARLLSRRNYPDDSTLESRLIERFRRRLTQSNNTGQAVQIIELGAGTGLVSIILAALFVQCTPDCRLENSIGPVRRARILATDLPSAIGLIEHNRVINEHLFRNGSSPHGQDSDSPPIQCACQVKLYATDLDWDKPIPAGVWELETDTGVELDPMVVRAHPFDIIVMADVTYNTASFSALLDTVTALLKGPALSSSAAAPMILLAYKHRDPAERTLWDDALARGISFVRVDLVKGVKEPAVEIWLGGWEKDVKSLRSDPLANASKIA